MKIAPVPVPAPLWSVENTDSPVYSTFRVDSLELDGGLGDRRRVLKPLMHADSSCLVLGELNRSGSGETWNSEQRRR